MRLLLLSPFPYGPGSGQGGATACANALRKLVQRHQVAAVCFHNGSEAENTALREMTDMAALVLPVPLRINKLKVLRAKLQSIFSPTPEHAIYFASAEYRSTLRTTMDTFRPDVVICQFPQMAQYLHMCGGTPAVQDVQDAFSVSWYRRANAAPGKLAKLYALKQWRNWLAYEQRHYAHASQCWTLSEQDKYGLTVFSPELTTHCVGVPLVNRVEKPSGRQSTKAVGFIGSYGHAPNIEALRFVLNHIVGKVTARLPDVQFTIAGRNPPSELVRTAAPNVRFAGFVDSLEDFYGGCSVIIAPLLSGGGVKIKVAEALCHGKAVVTTSVGAEGISMQTGVHGYIANNPDSFADAVCLLLTDQAHRMQIETAAARLAAESFAADAWAERIDQHLHQLCTPALIGGSG